MRAPPKCWLRFSAKVSGVGRHEYVLISSAYSCQNFGSWRAASNAVTSSSKVACKISGMKAPPKPSKWPFSARIGSVMSRLCSYCLRKNQLLGAAVQLAEHGARRTRKKQRALDEQERRASPQAERVAHFFGRKRHAKALLGVR